MNKKAGAGPVWPQLGAQGIRWLQFSLIGTMFGNDPKVPRASILESRIATRPVGRWNWWIPRTKVNRCAHSSEPGSAHLSLSLYSQRGLSCPPTSNSQLWAENFQTNISGTDPYLDQQFSKEGSRVPREKGEPPHPFRQLNTCMDLDFLHILQPKQFVTIKCRSRSEKPAVFY